MFRVKHPDYIDENLPLILGEPKILLFDGVPILYTGKNKYGSNIIGSSVDEDYENGFERYFHIIVSRSDFRKYLEQSVSYLELLKASPTIYVVDKYFGDVPPKIGITTFSEVPQRYVPTAHTYFPKSAYLPSFEYSTTLAGGLADENLAEPEHVSALQNSTTAFFGRALHTIRKILNFDIETKLRPASVGSYSINYLLRFTNYPPLYVSEEELLDFLNAFSEYCVVHLPEEVEKVLSSNDELADTKFQELFVKVLGLVPISSFDDEGRRDQERELRNSLKDDVLSTPKILAEIARVATQYGTLEFDNQDIPVVTIKADFSDTVRRLLDKLDAEQTDEQASKFEILVYSFNKRSGNGRAELLLEKKKSAIAFALPSQSDLASKQLLESMLENQFISVRGVMTYKAGVPTHLKLDE